MSTQDSVVLEWHYTPRNFFEEERFLVEHDGCPVEFSPGVVIATMPPELYDNEHKKRDEFHGVVQSYFQSVQLVTHKSFTLPKPGMCRIYPDGRCSRTLFAETESTQVNMGGRADTVFVDANGNVRDTKRDRINAEKDLATAIARIKGSDPFVEKLLGSYLAAVEDPANELVHLFEVVEILKSGIASGAIDKASSGISKNAWTRLGKLANDDPLRQGRHRGKHHANLRGATRAELEEARTIARRLIETYVRYADAR